MPLTQEELASLAPSVLSLLPEDGSARGNRALMGDLRNRCPRKRAASSQKRITGNCGITS